MARGGKRPGAGRKPLPLTVVRRAVGTFNKATAAEILATINELETWGQLLQDEDPNIRLKAVMYLTDRRDGKAEQTIRHGNATDDSFERLAEILAGAAAAANSESSVQ